MIGTKKDVTVTVNKGAKITLDGKKAKFADLKEGQMVKVIHEDAKASDVEAKHAKMKKHIACGTEISGRVWAHICGPLLLLGGSRSKRPEPSMKGHTP
jgi:ribosomal protein L6P/L9E